MGSAIRSSRGASPRSWPPGFGRAAALAEPGRANGADLCIAAESRRRPSGLPPDAPHHVPLAVALAGPARNGRPWPGTVSPEGQDRRFATRAGAMAFAEHARARGRTSLEIGRLEASCPWRGETFVPTAQASFLAHASYPASVPRTLRARAGGRFAGAGPLRGPEHAGRHRAALHARPAPTQAGTAGGRQGGPGEGPGVAPAEAPAAPCVHALPLRPTGGPCRGSLASLGG